MKFREHRGSLDDSMATVVELNDMDDLRAHIRKKLAMYPLDFRINEIKVEPYGRDDRIGWDTHIVTMPKYGVLGFTDGPVVENGP